MALARRFSWKGAEASISRVRMVEYTVRREVERGFGSGGSVQACMWGGAQLHRSRVESELRGKYQSEFVAPAVIAACHPGKRRGGVGY